MLGCICHQSDMEVIGRLRRSGPWPVPAADDKPDPIMSCDLLYFKWNWLTFLVLNIIIPLLIIHACVLLFDWTNWSKSHLIFGHLVLD